MALSVAIGGGLRLKETSALYRNQHPRGTGSSGTMICLHLKKPLLDIRTRGRCRYLVTTLHLYAAEKFPVL